MKVPFNDLTFQNEAVKTQIEQQFRKCITESKYIGGSALSEFERSFSQYVGMDHCIGTGNCTDALESGKLAFLK